MKLEEIIEDKESGSEAPAVPEQTKIDLNPEMALKTVIKALEDSCRAGYTLQEAEFANRAVRFFNKQKQMTEEVEKDMNYKKAMDIAIHCLNVGQKAKAFSLDESSLLLYSLGMIKET